MILKLVRFIQAPVRVLGALYYYIEIAFMEGKHDSYRYVAKKYHDEHFK